MLNLMYWVLVLGGLYVAIMIGIVTRGGNTLSVFMLNIPPFIVGIVSFIVGLDLLGFVNLSSIILK